MDTMQENVMLISPSFESDIHSLGNGVYVASPWTMDERKAHNFVGGIVSFHDTKSERSFVCGRILEVVSLGSEEFARNRVAFVFRRLSCSINPAQVRKICKGTLTESREQVRY